MNRENIDYLLAESDFEKYIVAALRKSRTGPSLFQSFCVDPTDLGFDASPIAEDIIDHLKKRAVKGKIRLEFSDIRPRHQKVIDNALILLEPLWSQVYDGSFQLASAVHDTPFNFTTEDEDANASTNEELRAALIAALVQERDLATRAYEGEAVFNSYPNIAYIAYLAKILYTFWLALLEAGIYGDISSLIKAIGRAESQDVVDYESTKIIKRLLSTLEPILIQNRKLRENNQKLKAVINEQKKTADKVMTFKSKLQACQKELETCQASSRLRVERLEKELKRCQEKDTQHGETIESIERHYIEKIKALESRCDILQGKLAMAPYCNPCANTPALQASRAENTAGRELDIDFSALKVLLVGGHENFLKKVQSRYPNWIVPGTGLFTLSPTKLDLVVYFTDHCGHSLWQTGRTIAAKTAAMEIYASSVNIDAFVTEVQEKLRLALCA